MTTPTDADTPDVNSSAGGAAAAEDAHDPATETFDRE